MTAEQSARPSVLYVCVHNAGRSQMAAAYTTNLSGGAVDVRSAAWRLPTRSTPRYAKQCSRRTSTSPPRSPRS